MAAQHPQHRRGAVQQGKDRPLEHRGTPLQEAKLVHQQQGAPPRRGGQQTLPRRVEGGPVGPHAMGLHRGNAQGLPRLQQLQRQPAARPIPVGTEPAGGLRPPHQIAGDGGGLSALERAGQKNVHHTASPLYWGKTKRRILKKDTATQGGPCAEGRRGLSFLFKHGRHRRFPRHPAAPAGAIGPPALGHPVGGRTRNSIHLYL